MLQFGCFQTDLSKSLSAIPYFRDASSIVVLGVDIDMSLVKGYLCLRCRALQGWDIAAHGFRRTDSAHRKAVPVENGFLRRDIRTEYSCALTQ